MADTHDSKSCAARHGSSTLPPGTMKKLLLIGLVIIIAGTGYLYFKNQTKPTPQTTCIDQPGGEGQPVIYSVTPDSVLSGDKKEYEIEIRGCNLAGFEGDKNVWIDNGKVKGILYGEAGSTPTLIKVKIVSGSRICQKDTSYSGLPCDAWLDLNTGFYNIYANPWGKESNKVKFTISTLMP